MKKLIFGAFVSIIFLVVACTKDKSSEETTYNHEEDHKVESRSDFITGHCAQVYTDGKDCTQTTITEEVTVRGCKVTVEFISYYCTDGTKFFSEPRLTGYDTQSLECDELIQLLNINNYIETKDWLAFYVNWKQELNHAVVTAYMSQWTIASAPPWFTGNLWTVEIVESVCYAVCIDPNNGMMYQAPCGFGCCKISYNYNTITKEISSIEYEQLSDGECGGGNFDDPCDNDIEYMSCVMTECGQ